jgi:hypothetical protein
VAAPCSSIAADIALVISEMRTLLEDAGFEVVGVSYKTGHSFWMYSFHHALKYGLSFPWLARFFDPLSGVPALVGDVPGSVEFLKRSALPTLSR